MDLTGVNSNKHPTVSRQVVFALVVVDELDDLSYRSKVTSDRARGVIRVMEKLKIGPKGCRRGPAQRHGADPDGPIHACASIQR